MQKALTNKTLEALKPQTKRYEVHDLHCPGMSVRVSAQGQKVFSVKFRYGLDQKRMKLGVFPRITLATAREMAQDILRQVDEELTRPNAGAAPICVDRRAKGTRLGGGSASKRDPSFRWFKQVPGVSGGEIGMLVLETV